VLLRDRRLLQDAFTIHPEYLQDVHRDREAVNFGDHGIQLTRGFRALKLWMSIQVFGLDAFRRAVDRGFDLAEMAERILRESPRWEVTTPALMGVVCFRYLAPGRTEEELDALQTGIVDGLRAGGFAMATSTRLRGRTALRLCPINPRTTDEDIRATIEHMAALGERL
jgi:aromatic-L-amino-acid decarboxylase